MLVLTRKVGQSIRIGDDIEVMITAVVQSKVRVGIRSPHHIPVFREEVYQKMKEENREAAHVGTEDLEEAMKGYSPGGLPLSPDDK